jgi:hypothetical protein
MNVPGPSETPRGLELVAGRRLIADGPLAWFDMHPGDRSLVAAGQAVAAGAALFERLRDSHPATPPSQPDADALPGQRFVPLPGRIPSLRGRPDPLEVELLHHPPSGWRVVAGEVADTLDVPAAGIVREVVHGVGVAVALEGHALLGTSVAGVPARGRLVMAAEPAGELRPSALDVGLAGTIVVAGARVSAETLSRGRAMGIRGVVVASLGQKELRDFRASEARQRAALHRLEPFAILVLDGTARRPIAGPMVAILAALAGRDVAIVPDPPALLFPDDDAAGIRPQPDLVRIRHGPDAGREGRFVEPLGRRRFAANVQAEAARVGLPDGRDMTVPLADLERFV